MARISKLFLKEIVGKYELELADKNSDVMSQIIAGATSKGGWMKDEALQWAEKLKHLIVTLAGTEFTLSQFSIFNSINNIDIGEITDNGDGTYKINLDLWGDLTRPSLNPNREGAYNIVSLFIHGWDARDTFAKNKKWLWGNWHGRKVGARAYKEPMDFAEQAVEIFNKQYEEFGVHAELSDEYK